ncbi:hypothetical protein GCM10010247_03160 [Streptomyces calvus]|nr:hypothetical protein GCM10010247_03160 [Streptomyces calvus]
MITHAREILHTEETTPAYPAPAPRGSPLGVPSAGHAGASGVGHQGFAALRTAAATLAIAGTRTVPLFAPARPPPPSPRRPSRSARAATPLRAVLECPRD